MAQLKETRTPLRHLRETLGMTVQRFAAEIHRLVARTTAKKVTSGEQSKSVYQTEGFSASSLEKVEKGERTLSVEIADALGIRFGVLPQSLMRKCGPALMQNGEEVSKEALARSSACNARQVDQTCIEDNLALQLNTILKACFNRPLSEQRIITEKISDFFEDICKNHGLEELITKHLEKRAITSERNSVTVEDLNSELGSVPEWKALAQKLTLSLRGAVTETRTLFWSKQGGAVSLREDNDVMILPVVSQNQYEEVLAISFPPKYKLTLTKNHHEYSVIHPTHPETQTISITSEWKKRTEKPTLLPFAEPSFERKAQ